MKTKIEIIKETVEYYSADVSRRSIFVTELGLYKCMYNSPDGKQCAFARCAEPIDSKYESYSSDKLLLEAGIKILKPEYRHIVNKSFWHALQRLHDKHSHWGDRGLTEAGKTYVKKLMDKYKD